MAAPYKFLGATISGIFAGCEAWKQALLGGAGKTEFRDGMRAARDELVAFGLDAHTRGSTQFVYPHPHKIFAAFRFFEPAALRAVVVGLPTQTNSGLAFPRGEAIGCQDARMWASAGVLMLPSALTSRIHIVMVDAVAQPDPRIGIVPGNWTVYMCGLLGRIAEMYHVPIVVFDPAFVLPRSCTIPGLRRADLAAGVQECQNALAIVPRWAEVLAAPPYRHVLIYATDGSCTNNGRAGAVGGWGVHSPELYANTRSANPGNWSGYVSLYEWSLSVPASTSGPNALGAASAATNNRAELIAAIVALQLAIAYTHAHPHHGLSLHLVLDSSYVIGTLLQWGWSKSAGDFAEVAHNRDLIRVLIMMLVEYAELLRPGCGMASARAVLFAPWQRHDLAAGSLDMAPFYWPGISVFLQRGHQRLPEVTTDWRENLAHDRAAANAAADGLAQAAARATDLAAK